MMLFSFFIGIVETPAGTIMTIDYIIRIAEEAARADKAAVGTINRPLQFHYPGYFCSFTSLRPQLEYMI
jgi:hypothetical protein